MTDTPLLDHLTRWANATPDTPLFQFPTGDAREMISYRRATAMIGGLATALRSRGMGIGKRVVAQVPSTPESVLLCLATQWVGGVHVPLNPALSDAETALLIDDADPTVVIRGADEMAELVRAPTALLDPTPRHATDPAAIIYTSGTTGRPKGAIVTHGNLASNAEALVHAWGFEAHDVTAHALPTFHAHGLFVAVNTALVAGSSLFFLGRFDVDRIIDALEGPATVLMGVPTFYSRLLSTERFTREVVENVRLFISGSAPLTEKVFGEFEARTGRRILERYGMSETEMITSNPFNGERIGGSVGFALPGVEIRIRTDDDPGRPIVTPGDTGGIEVRGPNVFAGYWRMPERQAIDFTADGWFRTGDLGTIDAHGRLRIVGRAKDLIISGGENVYPAEIELILDQLPGIAESTVVGMPDDDFGELGLAIVVADPDGPMPDPEALLDALRTRLAPFKIPRACVTVDALPRNAMGKVRKAVLRERFATDWPILRDR